MCNSANAEKGWISSIILKITKITPFISQNLQKQTNSHGVSNFPTALEPTTCDVYLGKLTNFKLKIIINASPVNSLH